MSSISCEIVRGWGVWCWYFLIPAENRPLRQRIKKAPVFIPARWVKTHFSAFPARLRAGRHRFLPHLSFLPQISFLPKIHLTSI